MKYFLIFLVLVGFVGLTYAYDDETLYPTSDVDIPRENYTLATLEWSQGNFRVTNGTGTAKVIVTDPDLNQISSYVDTLNVNVTSDSFQEGILLKLYETGKNSGVFERTFTLSEERSAPNVLYVREGDTATVTYTDKTLPLENPFSEIVLMDTALVGYSAPPLERAPASHARIVDSFGNSIYSPAVGQQVQIKSDVANGSDREQKFAYIVMIQDDTDTAVFLAWIDGILNPESSFSPSASWIPQKEGNYVATMFVWESVVNPSALSPPIQIGFTVISEEEQKVRQHDDGDYLEMFMFIVPQDRFEKFSDSDLKMLHYYNIDSKELSSLPRLSLLVDMTEDFSHTPVSKLGLRINNEQIEQYNLFFEQKCKEQRPYAANNACMNSDFAFEYDEKWYYAYPRLAPHQDALEDSTNSWDPEYFTRHEN